MAAKSPTKTDKWSSLKKQVLTNSNANSGLASLLVQMVKNKIIDLKVFGLKTYNEILIFR